MEQVVRLARRLVAALALIVMACAKASADHNAEIEFCNNTSPEISVRASSCYVEDGHVKFSVVLGEYYIRGRGAFKTGWFVNDEHCVTSIDVNNTLVCTVNEETHELEKWEGTIRAKSGNFSNERDGLDEKTEVPGITGRLHESVSWSLLKSPYKELTYSIPVSGFSGQVIKVSLDYDYHFKLCHRSSEYSEPVLSGATEKKTLEFYVCSPGTVDVKGRNIYRDDNTVYLLDDPNIKTDVTISAVGGGGFKPKNSLYMNNSGYSSSFTKGYGDLVDLVKRSKDSYVSCETYCGSDACRLLEDEGNRVHLRLADKITTIEAENVKRDMYLCGTSANNNSNPPSVMLAGNPLIPNVDTALYSPRYGWEVSFDGSQWFEINREEINYNSGVSFEDGGLNLKVTPLVFTKYSASPVLYFRSKVSLDNFNTNIYGAKGLCI